MIILSDSEIELISISKEISSHSAGEYLKTLKLLNKWLRKSTKQTFSNQSRSIYCCLQFKRLFINFEIWIFLIMRFSLDNQNALYPGRKIGDMIAGESA